MCTQYTHKQRTRTHTHMHTHTTHAHTHTHTCTQPIHLHSVADSGTASGNGSRPQSIIDQGLFEGRPHTGSFGKNSALSMVSDQGVESDTTTPSVIKSDAGSGMSPPQPAEDDVAVGSAPSGPAADKDAASEPMVKITMIDDARLKTFREQFQSNK